MADSRFKWLIAVKGVCGGLRDTRTIVALLRTVPPTRKPRIPQVRRNDGEEDDQCANATKERNSQPVRMQQLWKSTDSIADGVARWVADETTDGSTAQFQPRAKSYQILCFPHKAGPTFLNRCTLLSYSTIACLAPYLMRSHWLQSSRPWFLFHCSLLSFATPNPVRPHGSSR